jgi:hypothetical protein
MGIEKISRMTTIQCLRARGALSRPNDREGHDGPVSS